MSVNRQFDNQSEGLFNIIGNSELAMEIEEDNIGVVGNSELAMIVEDDSNGDKPEDNTNMDVDKTMAVVGVASGSECNTAWGAMRESPCRLALLMAMVYHQHLHCRLALLMPQFHHLGIGGIRLMQHHIGLILHCRPRCRLR